MPHKDDFSDAASAFEKMRQECEVFVQRLEAAMSPSVLDGGELTRSVYESLKRTRAETLTMSASIEMYMEECQRRLKEWRAAKAAQEEYEEDLAVYRVKKGIWDGEGSVEFGTLIGATLGEEEPVPPTPPPTPPDYIDL